MATKFGEAFGQIGSIPELLRRFRLEEEELGEKRKANNATWQV